MVSSIINIVHFHNGTGGGVLSVIRNLLLYKQHEHINNHVIYTINKDQLAAFEIPKLIGAASEQVFYYSPKWNFYYTCSQLAKLLPDDKTIIVAHDWLELGMVSNLGLQNRVIHFLHGDYDYYYDLAKKNEAGVDAFVCVADNIEQRLAILLPQRLKDIQYLRFPVGYSKGIKKNSNGFNVVFVGRCTYDKGYPFLPFIAKSLVDKKMKVFWHIAGELKPAEREATQWPTDLSVTFYGNIPNESVQTLLCDMDVIVLPSFFEGMPINIIEAMKAGVVPVVNDLDGGLQELIIDGDTGIKITGNRKEGFVDALKGLADNLGKLSQISANARQRANEMFDPVANTVAIENLYENVNNLLPKKKFALKVYGSKLDQKWLGNNITYTVRNKFKRKDMLMKFPFK